MDKEKIKNLLRRIIYNLPMIREAIIKLNKVAVEDDMFINTKPIIKKSDMITEKAMYSGYSIDYLNYKFLTKEERMNELKRIFYNKCRYYLDLDNPITFNQKLQWLKLNYADPVMSRCVDKCEFKRYIAEQVGEQYVVPLYGEWDHENKINFDELPDKFVLKSNVQSDGRHIIIVNDKKNINLDKIKTVMSSWLLRRNTLCCSYCNPYHSVKPKILAEKFIEGFDDSLTDYKFMCFNGKAEMLFVVAGRKKNMCVNFYDLEWNLLPFTRVYPNTKYSIPKPKNFELMLEIANKLAKPFPFVRVDFYESKDGNDVYVGELTFYPGGGLEAFQPFEWDKKLGEMIHLPEANI